MSGNGAYHDRSVLIHGKFKSEKWDFQDHILPPVTTAVCFRLRSADRGAQGFQQFANPNLPPDTHPIYIYDRLDEPCVGLLEETLAFAEKGESAVSFSTGMAAISAAIGINVRAGDAIVFHPALYGCTHSHIVNWLSRFGVGHFALDLTNLDALRDTLVAHPEITVVYFETPSNPTMELIDLAGVAAAVSEVNRHRAPDRQVVTVVDNTFASPFGQRPLTHGIDLVVHSLTKHIGGFGATMGGVVIGAKSRETELLMYRKDFGASLAPDPAWHILVYGIPTLAVRLERQQVTAQRVAEYLESHPRVARVRYPGLGSFPQRELAERQMRDIDGRFAPGALLSFDIAGDPATSHAGARACINHLAENSLSITLAVSLGQIRTLVEHPASMTHSVLPPEAQAHGGIGPGLVRLSLGLEDPRDIIRDLGAALASIS